MTLTVDTKLDASARSQRMPDFRPIGDVWWLARCKYKGSVKRYGGYLGGFPERARALLGARLNEPVLHICGGLARLYPYAGGFGPGDKTLDLDPTVEPDILADAREPYPTGFRAILADPPYSEADAGLYAPGAACYPKLTVILRNGLDALSPGGRVGIIHYVVPAPPKGARFVAAVAIMCGFNNRVRVYSVFEKGADFIGRPDPRVQPAPDLLTPLEDAAIVVPCLPTPDPALR
jgi:hypothetical protein